MVIDYRDSAPVEDGLIERFLPGSLRLGPNAVLTVMHDRDRLLARSPDTLRLADSQDKLSLVADMPPTRESADAYQLVKSGVYQGLSIRYLPERERIEGSTRIVEAAYLESVGVVDVPAYPMSTLRARDKSLIRRLAGHGSPGQRSVIRRFLL